MNMLLQRAEQRVTLDGTFLKGTHHQIQNDEILIEGPLDLNVVGENLLQRCRGETMTR